MLTGGCKMAPAVPAEKDAAAQGITMFGKLGRLFVIKTRFEACAIIYALALGAVERGQVYLSVYPGFGGKLLIHPSQIAPSRAGFAPSPTELAWAQAVLAADNGGASALNGEMIDRPVLIRAHAIIGRAI